jgi:hypothetical protein
MWSIVNPRKVFDYIYQTNTNVSFELISIMRTDKYLSFSETSRNTIESSNLLHIDDTQIKDPNNPANLIEAKIITFVF